MSAGTNEPRPVVFLDVDGVLGARITQVEGAVLVEVRSVIVDLVQRLSHLGEIVWATSWGFDVRERLTEALGLPASTAGLAILPTGDPMEAKRAAVDRFLRVQEPADGWAAVAWLDDRNRPEDLEWAAASGWPIDLIAIDPDKLLSEDAVARARAVISARLANASIRDR